MVDLREAYDIINGALEDGSFAAMMTRGNSPLMDAWREMQKDRTLLFQQPWENGRISMGEGSYITPKTIIETSREILRIYGPRQSMLDWLNTQKSPKPNWDGMTFSSQQVEASDSLGDYFVPQEYTQAMLSKFQVLDLDIRRTVERRMIDNISRSIDEEFLYGRMLSAAEATSRVYNDPEEAFLDAALNRRRPKLYGGYDSDELSSFRAPRGILHGHDGSIQIGDSRYRPGEGGHKLKGSFASILGNDGRLRAEIPCRGVEFEHKVDLMDFVLMGVQEPIRRVVGQSITGQFVINRDAYQKLIRMMDRNAPMSGIKFDFELAEERRVSFMGGIERIDERQPMTIFGLPVYIADMIDEPMLIEGEHDPYGGEAVVHFRAFGPMNITIAGGMEYRANAQQFVDDRRNFWNVRENVQPAYRPRIKQIEIPVNGPTEYTYKVHPKNGEGEPWVDEDWLDEGAQNMEEESLVPTLFSTRLVANSAFARMAAAQWPLWGTDVNQSWRVGNQAGV